MSYLIKVRMLPEYLVLMSFFHHQAESDKTAGCAQGSLEDHTRI